MSPTTLPPADIPPPIPVDPRASGERKALLEAEAAVAEASDPVTRRVGAFTKLARALFGEGVLPWPRAVVLMVLIVSLLIAGMILVAVFWAPEGLEARVKSLEDDRIPPAAIEHLVKSGKSWARGLSRLECIVVRTRNPVTAATAEVDCLDRYPREE